MNDNEREREFEETELSLEKDDDIDATAGKAWGEAEETDEPSSPTGFPTRSFMPGDVIFREGESGNEAYLILNGQVKLTRKHGKKRLLIGQLGAEQIFGEMAIITGEPRTASAEAVEPTEVFIITEERLNENLSQHLAIVKTLVDQLIERLKQLLKQQSTMLGKVERALLLDKKLEKIKLQAREYELTKLSDEMDEDFKTLLGMIREV